MSSNTSIPENWHNLIIKSLLSESAKEKIFALDFLSQQTSLSLENCKELMPNITQSVVSPNKQVRDYARKARNHILDRYPEIETHQSSITPFKLEIKEGEKLTAQQILLHKLRLGSRFVVFEAMDRLTESGDKSLVEPLIDYIQQEKDEYKVSYLLRLMGRFDDKRVPELLEKYLDHEDSRIVANAIEALSDFDVHHLSQTFADFAMSRDLRVRSNAIRALHRYSPGIAEKHITEMVKSNSYSVQDMGVNLLRMVRPSNLGEMLNIAYNSRYADIRLKALDIQPPDNAETQNAEMLLKEDIEQPDEKRDLVFFTGFLIISIFLFIIVGPNNRYLLSLLFVGIGILTVIRPDKTRTSIQKTAISLGFISSIIWGSTKLMLLPSLMGLWLTWNGSHFNRRGKLEKARSESIFAWFFAMTSILATQFIQGNYDNILKLAGNILLGSENLQLKQEVIKRILPIVTKQTNFEITIYIFIAVMTLAIMTIDKWLPQKTKEGKPISQMKRLIFVSSICVASIVIINFCHIFGLKLLLHASGFKSATDVLKLLLP